MLKFGFLMSMLVVIYHQPFSSPFGLNVNAKINKANPILTSTEGYFITNRAADLSADLLYEYLVKVNKK